MRYALVAAWQRFKEVRHQQRVHGYDGPLAVYAACYAEVGDWCSVIEKEALTHPKDSVVRYMLIGERREE